MLLTRAAWTAYLLWHLRGQARAPFRPWPAIERDQARRVRRMVAYAVRHVPYYREAARRLGLRPDAFRSAADLARLPLLERDQLQRDPEYFVSTAVPRARLVELRSGGSTGSPRSVFCDPAALFQNAAHSARDRSIRARLLGRRAGYRQTLISSRHSGIRRVQEFLDAHALFPRAVRLERQYLSLADSPAENLARMSAFRPDVLHSYGSYLGRLFAHARDTGGPWHRPRVVTFGGDALSPAARALIQEELGIPVFGIYQAIEALRIGFECEAHRGLHLNVDLYPVRVVDAAGRTVPDGTSGEVVVSNLVNRGTVLLNYRLGDVAAALPDPCPCGRSLPLLAPPPGRTDDLVELGPGVLLHPQALRDLFTEEREVWQYQVIQAGPARFRIDLVVAGVCDRPATAARIARRFAEQLGGRAAAEVRFVDEVARTAQGKVRAVLAPPTAGPRVDPARPDGSRPGPPGAPARGVAGA
jgi:phenylacetate-CoA ligase